MNNAINTYGIKDLYDAQIVATRPMRIGNRVIEEKEPITVFKNIQIATFKELTITTSAKGGYKNKELINWEDTSGIYLKFTQGVFSEANIAISSNSAYNQIEEREVMAKEEITIGDDGDIELKYEPILNSLFVYNSLGDKIEKQEYEITGKRIVFKDSFLIHSRVTIYYDFLYKGKITKIDIGRALSNDYVGFRAKTRIKDDKTGEVRTGLIILPKVRLVSDLFITLGKDAPPSSISFELLGVLVGDKGQEKVMDFIFLDRDIDNE